MTGETQTSSGKDRGPPTAPSVARARNFHEGFREEAVEAPKPAATGYVFAAVALIVAILFRNTPEVLWTALTVAAAFAVTARFEPDWLGPAEPALVPIRAAAQSRDEPRHYVCDVRRGGRPLRAGDATRSRSAAPEGVPRSGVILDQAGQIEPRKHAQSVLIAPVCWNGELASALLHSRQPRISRHRGSRNLSLSLTVSPTVTASNSHSLSRRGRHPTHSPKAAPWSNCSENSDPTCRPAKSGG
jgi:hypothetical protein